MNEFEEAWESHVATLLERLRKAGAAEPTNDYLARAKERFIFDELTGEYIPDRAYTDPASKLAFYRSKLKEYRALGNPKINRYIIERIKEVL